LEITFHKRRGLAIPFERVIELFCRAVDSVDGLLFIDEGIDRVERVTCRSAAVIAQTPKDRHIPLQPQSHLFCGFEPLREIVVLGVIVAIAMR